MGRERATVVRAVRADRGARCNGGRQAVWQALVPSVLVSLSGVPTAGPRTCGICRRRLPRRRRGRGRAVLPPARRPALLLRLPVLLLRRRRPLLAAVLLLRGRAVRVPVVLLLRRPRPVALRRRGPRVAAAAGVSAWGGRRAVLLLVSRRRLPRAPRLRRVALGSARGMGEQLLRRGLGGPYPNDGRRAGKRNWAAP